MMGCYSMYISPTIGFGSAFKWWLVSLFRVLKNRESDESPKDLEAKAISQSHFLLTQGRVSEAHDQFQ